jgi:hypothetical protein
VQLAPIQVSNALDCSSQVNQGLTAQNLSGTGLAAQPGREVQGSTAIPALDRQRLTGIYPDPHGEREMWVGLRCPKESRLELDRRPDGLSGGAEHREGFVASQFDHGSLPGLYLLPNDLGEPGGELGGRFVPVLLGEVGVPTDVRDEERPDLLARLVGAPAFGVPDASPGRCKRSLIALRHMAEY